MSGVGDEMGDLGAEVFADGSAHVVNQIHQVLLQRRQKEQQTQA